MLQTDAQITIQAMISLDLWYESNISTLFYQCDFFVLVTSARLKCLNLGGIYFFNFS